MGCKIKLEIFEGPLDLLLYLIKKNHINIYDIPITDVTKQYLEYLELMKLLNLDIVGEFLVIAATLIQIKSRMLLPQEETPPEEEEEDPRAELVKRLLEYQKFKDAAEDLREKESTRRNIFTRTSDKPLEQLGEDSEVYFEANLFDLISAFSKALKDIPKEVFYEVMKDDFTVDQKIHDILHALLERPTISLTELFSNAKNKLEIIANFLAVLELIRLKEIVVVQKNIFGDIKILRNKNNISPYARREK